MKKINAELIDARLDDIQRKVSNARFIERLEASGTTPEELTMEVKTLLNLEQDDLIGELYEVKLQPFFKTATALRNLVNLENALIALEMELTEEHNNLKKEIGNKLAEMLDVEVDDLYIQESDI